MLRPRSLALPLFLAAAIVAGHARPAAAFDPLVAGDESAAHPDGSGALLFNPAAASTRYPSELALAMRHDRAGSDVYRGSLLMNGFMLSTFGAEGAPLGWGLGLAGGSDAMRFGIAHEWIPDGHGRTGDLRAGLLSRPLPWLSIGVVVEHANRPRLAGGPTDRAYTLGLGVRPLAFLRPVAHSVGTRLTLTADAALAEGGRVDDARLRWGVEVEPVLGIRLRGSYRPDGRSFQLGVSLLGVGSGYHGSSAFDRDRHLLGSTHAVSFHEAEDRTVLAGPKDRRVAVIRVGGPLADDAIKGFSIFGPESGVPVAPIHHQLERALEDPLTHGVLLEIGGAGNMAQLEELRPRIARLRAAGKPVVAWLPAGGGRGDLYLAAACDRIVTSPEAFYVGLGLRAERRSYRKLLADWGLRIDRTSYGKYKSAYRNFSVDSTPPADREAIEHALDTYQEMYVAQITADRRMSRARLLTLLDGRRWIPGDLVSAGLVDTVGYRETALAVLGRLADLGDKPHAARLSHPTARVAWTLPTRIAVVYASGGIESGRSGNDLLLGPVMGSETLGRQIESAFKRRDVDAVVLRIESPGGTTIGSDFIHHTLVRMRGETGKPLIVSMGGAAASGGYNIALPGEKLFADRWTRTGSIGVLFVKPSLERWYEKHDVKQEFFERGRYMRGTSLAQDWDREIQASADSSNLREYRDFVELVARSRNMTWDQTNESAQGRVWLGEEARERKLVDAIGGLEDAIAEARRRAHVPAGEKLAIVEYRRPRPGFVDRVVGSFVTDAWQRNTMTPAPGEALYWMDDEEW